MNDYLTIGELAQLMGTSTHQLRYFEEKGVLLPERISAGGYRQYGIEQVYTLGHILYLREFDIPVSGIKDCFEHYSEEDYKQLLMKKTEEMDKEIQRLTALKNYTTAMLTQIEADSKAIGDMTIETKPERHLKTIGITTQEQMFSVRELYMAYKDIEAPHKKDLMIYAVGNQLFQCYEAEGTAQENHQSTSTMTIPPGDYLTHNIDVSEEHHWDEAFERMLEYAEAKGLTLEERYLIKEKSMVSIIKKDAMHYSIEIAIKGHNR